MRETPALRRAGGKRRTSTFPQTNGSTIPSIMTRPTRWNQRNQSTVPAYDRRRTSGNTGKESFYVARNTMDLLTVYEVEPKE